MSKKDNNSVTIFPFIIVTVTTIILFFLLLGLGLFILLYEPWRVQLDITTGCIIGFFCGFWPLLLIILAVRRGLSVIKVNENGVGLLAFGFIKLLEMKWDNITEIRYYERLGIPFIFISKTKPLAERTYDYIIKQKDVIQIQLSKKVYDVISKYIQQPIIGLTEEKLTMLKLK